MIKYFTGLLTGLFLVFSTSASAEDFETSQHNFKFKQNNFSFEYRETLDSDLDHLQLGYEVSPGVTLEYRYADTADRENRFRINSKYELSPFVNVGAKVEYRDFKYADDYYRVIPVIKISTGKLTNMEFYANFEPRFNFGKQGESNDLRIDTTQSKIGFDYHLTDKATFGPFLQYETDKNFNKTNVFFGTSVSVNF